MSAPSSVERVLARMRESGDFPAMATTVGQITTLTSSEATSTSALADTVLQDYGLAQNCSASSILPPSHSAVLNYLKVLRGQAIVAIRHKAARPASRRT